MSFTWFSPDGPLRTKEQVAAEVYQVALARDLDELAAVLCCMGIDVEVGAEDDNGVRQWWCPANPDYDGHLGDNDSMAYPHDSLSDDGRSCGYLQQQKSVTGAEWWGTTASEMSLSTAANNFLDRLTDDYHRAANDAHLAGQFVQAVQGSGFPDRYQDHWDLAWATVRAAVDGQVAPVDMRPAPVLAPTPVDEPDFKEVNLIGVSAISNNSQPRGGTTIDLEIGHTTEGSGGMDLVNYMIGAEVSYHRLIDNDLDGNTVFNLVDSARASWSVGDANNRSINYVIGRSTVEWTREQWLADARNAIRIMAWLMLQDAAEHNVAVRVLLPAADGSYPDDPPGITDHRYVTKHIGWGEHSDLDGPDGPYGPPYVRFPWDVLQSDLAELDGKEPGDNWMTAVNADRLNMAVDKILGYPDDPKLKGRYPSRARTRPDNNGVDDGVGMSLWAQADGYDLLTAYCANEFNDADCIKRLTALAAGTGPGAKYDDGTTDQGAIDWAKGVLKAVAAKQNTAAPAKKAPAKKAAK